MYNQVMLYVASTKLNEIIMIKLTVLLKMCLFSKLGSICSVIAHRIKSLVRDTLLIK